MASLAEVLGEKPEAPEEGMEDDSSVAMEAAIDDLEASSNITVSDRKAFAEAIMALMECCGGGEYEDDEPSSPKHGKPSIAIMFGGPKK